LGHREFSLTTTTHSKRITGLPQGVKLMLGTGHKVPLIIATHTIETNVKNSANIALVIEAGSKRWS
jgi:hypothetical protein